MNEKFKIEISNIAHEKLKELFHKNPEYNFLKLYSAPFCGKKEKIEIMASDEKFPNDETFIFKDITILYDKKIIESFKNIFLIYEDDTFKISFEDAKDYSKSMEGCKKHSCGSSCSCSSGSGCKL